MQIDLSLVAAVLAIGSTQEDDISNITLEDIQSPPSDLLLRGYRASEDKMSDILTQLKEITSNLHVGEAPVFPL